MLSKLKHRNNKQKYYLLNYLSLILPDFLFRNRLRKILNSLKNYEILYIKDRVNYYNKLKNYQELPAETNQLKEFKIKNFHRTYFFDTNQYTRFYDKKLKLNMLFGDIVHVPQLPSIVKSRPINNNNQNSILLKLNKIRHFTFTNDKNKFENKKNKLIGRSAISIKHKKRIEFFKIYFNHPLCNLGAINKNTPYPKWLKNKISIEDHLKYKFIMCVEGVDVATNLKWVMSSKSIAVMPKPKIESWFMENRLIPDYHYIEIKEDYSNLETKLNHFIKNTKKCNEIIKNANEYVLQFKNKKRENLISLLVLEKYFHFTNQKKKISSLDY